jgi:hypothetical protein
MDTNTNTENLNLDFNSLNKGILRQQNINNFCLRLYNFLKENNYKVVEKDFLKSFISNCNNERTKRKIFQEIIQNLISKSKIEKTVKTTYQKQLRNIKELLTFDNESYKILMSNNGFKSYVYKWVKNDNKAPTRVLIGVYGINQIPNDILTPRNVVIENKTPMTLKNKSFGCFDNNNKSLIMTYNKHSKIAYLIL